MSVRRFHAIVCLSVGLTLPAIPAMADGGDASQQGQTAQQGQAAQQPGQMRQESQRQRQRRERQQRQMQQREQERQMQQAQIQREQELQREQERQRAQELQREQERQMQQSQLQQAQIQQAQIQQSQLQQAQIQQAQIQQARPRLESKRQRKAAKARKGQYLSPLAPFKMPDIRSNTQIGKSMEMTRQNGGTVATAKVHAQLEVAPQISAFMAIPMAHAMSGDIQGLEVGGERDLGNITVGTRYVEKKSENMTLSSSFSVSLPTSPGRAGGVEFSKKHHTNGGAAELASRAHFDRFAEFAPNAISVKQVGDVRFDSGPYMLQMELGIQHLDTDDKAMTMIKANTAAGVCLTENLALVGELSSNGVLTMDAHQEDNERWFHALDLGMRYSVGNMHLGKRLYLPIDMPTSNGRETFGMGIDISGKF